MAKEKEVNELECECGHVAGAPATLRIHKSTHGASVVVEPEVEKPAKKVTAKKK